MSKAKEVLNLFEDWTPIPEPEKKKKPRRSKQLIKAEKALRFALSEQERYMGSVFVNAHGQRKHEERVEQAYADYRRAGGTLDI